MKTVHCKVHCSFSGLTDALGSVLHRLIEYCLKHYHVLVSELNYIMSLYSKLREKIITEDWIIEVFEFCRGIFAGDNYSPIIFNVVFQPSQPVKSVFIYRCI